MAVFKGTAGDDTLTGTTGNDRFVLTKGGNDTASGGDGNDLFILGATLTAADRLDGGSGTDAVTLKGDYGAGLAFGAATIVGIERLNLSAGFNYGLTMNDGNVAAGERLTVNGTNLGAANHLVFDGSAESDGAFVVTGGAGNDTITGGALRDTFNLARGGNDTVHGGGGNDTFNMGAAFAAQDAIDGGTGSDTVVLDGNYSAGLVFGAATMTNVETLRLTAGHAFDITTNDANVGAGQTLTVDASTFAARTALVFDGAAESDGSFDILAGAGNDVLTGGNAGNVFDLTLGGRDTVTGGLGVNVFDMGAAFDTGDRLMGAAGGSNTLILNGAYAGLTVNNTIAANIQTLEIQGSNAVSLIWKATPALTLDASAAGGSLSFDFSTVTSTLHYIGGALNAQVTGGGGADIFDAGSGIDAFSGGGNNDVFNFGANLTAADSVNGGGGSNTLTLNGDYSAGLVFGAATMTNVQALTLLGAHDYNLTTSDTTVAAGQILTVDAGALTTSRHLVFNGAAESDGRFAVIGGAGSDTVTGGAQADSFDLSHGGNDIAQGGGGNDVFTLGAALNQADRIDGGAGNDTVILNGDYSAGGSFGAATIVNIETLQLAAGHSYSLTTNNANVASGQSLTVDASALGGINAVSFNGSAESDGRFAFIGGAGNDTFIGGNAGNSFDLTHGGSDIADGGQGINVFNLGAAFDGGDRINGALGAGNTLILNGAYIGLGVTNAMAANIQTLDIQGTNTTSIVWQAAASAPMTLDASAAGGSLTFDYSAVNAALHFIGGALNTHITGSSVADVFDAGTAADFLSGSGGNDVFNFAGNLTAADQVDGGSGSDTVTLNGDYSAGLTFAATTMVNVETLTLAAGHSYSFATNDATVATDAMLTIDASALGAGDTLTLNGAAESDGTFSVKGGAGNDLLMVGAGLMAASTIDGGAGSDTLVLNGDYSEALTFGAATMTNVETLRVAAGHNYNLITSDSNLAAGQILTVDAGALGAGNGLTFNGGAESDGSFAFTGGAGNDALSGGAQADSFDLTLGGGDSAHGNGGNDIFLMGAALGASDGIDGGTGTDSVVLNGDYSAGITLGASTLTGIETLQFAAGHAYNLTSDDGNVAAGQTLTVDGSALGASDSLTFNGAAETNGSFAFIGGTGSDALTGGAQADSFDLTRGGSDNVHGGGGNDVFTLGAALSAADSIDGGTGSDTLVLSGDYSAGLALGAVTNVETLQLAAGNSYNLTSNDGNVAAGQTLTVDGSASDTLSFDGSAESNGSFAFIGGAGDDALTGGAQADSFDLTHGGTDTAHGNGGSDVFTLGAMLSAADTIDGGAGSDTLVLNGDYSAGFAFTATTMTNIETLQLATGHSYALTTDDATVASGQTLSVDAGALGAADTLTLDASAESDGLLSVAAGAGNDTVTFGSGFAAADHVDGGAGSDTLVLDGDYAGLTFGAATMVNVETLQLGAGHSYHLATNDANVASGQVLTVDAGALGAGDALVFDGSAESNGAFAVTGGAGDDTVTFGGSFVAADTVDGGAGHDTLVLNGDYSAGLTFGAAAMTNVETLQLVAGHSYNLATNDANVAAGETLAVDASALGAANTLTFNATAESDGFFAVTGGSGNDRITFAGNFTGADHVDGGAGSDTLALSGNYLGGIVFGNTTIANIETLSLAAGNSYNLTTADGNIASGATMTVDGSALSAANGLTFNGGAESDGAFAFLAGAGNDLLTGGGQADSFAMTAGGIDTVHGGGGNDTITLGATLTAADTIDGGAGSDTVTISGGAYGAFTFGAATMTNIETLTLASNDSYNLTFDDANVAAGQTLTIDDSPLTLGHTFTVNAQAESDGYFNVIGGKGVTTVAYAGNFVAADRFAGHSGSDVLNLNGDYSSGVTFAANTIVGVNQILLGAGHSYNLTTNDANVAAGGQLFVTAGAGFGPSDNITFDGSAETDGSFLIGLGAGNDTIVLGAQFRLTDFLNAGAGTDTLKLNGDYSAGMTFTGTTIVGFETLLLAGGHSYNFTTNDGNVASGATLTIDASTLGAGDTLTFNGAAETNGGFAFISGAGNDALTGGAGNDSFAFGARLGAADKINGGAGTDTLSLNGDYSAGVTFGATTLVNVETLSLAAGHGYNLTTNDATVASAATFTVDASALGAGDSLTFNGAAETNGKFAFIAGGGTYTLTGGAGADTFSLGAGLTAADGINGGAGSDSASLNGDYSAGVVFGATTMVNVETLTLAAGHSYNLTIADATVASGAVFTVNAGALGAADTLTFDGSADTNGTFAITGGAGNDVITIGGVLNSSTAIAGGAGTDTLILNGSNFSTNFFFTATTMTGIEIMRFAAGHNYTITVEDPNLGGGTFTVDASALGAANSLHFANGDDDAVFSFTGGAGNDSLSGGALNDTFDLTHGGDDVALGNLGNDTFLLGATLTAADRIDGTSGTDKVILDGDYSAGIVLGASTILNIDTVQLTAGHSYNITVNQANLASGASMTYDGSTLGAGTTLTFNGAAETDGFLTIKGGAGDDVISTGASATVDIGAGGNDTVHGGSGGDTVYCEGGLDNSDSLDGGAGRDFVYLNGDYSSGLALAATTLMNFEGMAFVGGHDYDITVTDAFVVAATQSGIDASNLGASDSLVFDGSAELDGAFVFTGGAGDDTLTGGNGSDIFNLGKGGNDTVKGGIGNESFQLDAALTAADRIDGGSGNDTVTLNGDYSAGVVLGANTLVGIENMTINIGHNYNLTFDDATIAAGATMTINISLGFNSFVLDDRAETNGTLHVSGVTSGDDIYIFGAGLIGSGDQVNTNNSGYDTIKLDGDFSGGFTFGATTAVGFEELDVMSGHSYVLTTDNATVANGINFVVDASALGAGNSLTFDGSAEIDGTFAMKGGAGNDVLTGGVCNDSFDISLGGNDTVHGGGSINTVLLGAALTAADAIDAGSGGGLAVFNGDYSSGLVLGATTLTHFTTFQFAAGHSYDITTNDATVTTLGLSVDGSALGAGDTLTFNGTAETSIGFGFVGGAGNDALTGGGGGDSFDLSKGGADTVKGGGGNDIFDFVGAFTGADSVDGGTGSDSFSMSGGYTGSFGNILNVESVEFGAGVYNITTTDAFGTAGETILVNASGTTSMTFNAGADTDAAFDFTGGNGNDILTGGAGNDSFHMGQFGVDVARGGGGDDFIDMANTFGVTDQIDGGSGNDTVSINFSGAAMVFAALTLTNVETFDLLGRNNNKYLFTMDDNNVAAGATMTVDASATITGDQVSINASAESDGSYHFISGASTSTSFTGGAQADLFDMTRTGTTYSANGSGGNDTFLLGTSFHGSDTVDGGTGSDTVNFAGGASLTLSAITNIEALTVAAGSSYSFVSVDATVSSGATLTVDGSTLTATSISFNGSAETNGRFAFIGGASGDAFTGGAGADSFDLTKGGSDIVTGKGGADSFTAGIGATDTFVYGAVSESTSTGYDTIAQLDFAHDRFAVSTIAAVTGVDAALATGALSTASFDGDLSGDVGAGQLAAHHAMLFTADQGDLAGHTFLVVDENGVAGYQSGADLVIEVTGATGTLTMSDFT